MFSVGLKMPVPFFKHTAMEAGVADHVWSLEEVIALLD
jgi:hypothetical protein